MIRHMYHMGFVVNGISQRLHLAGICMTNRHLVFVKDQQAANSDLLSQPAPNFSIENLNAAQNSILREKTRKRPR